MPLVVNENGSATVPATSNSIYEIVMVAVAGGIMLVCGAVFILLVMKRRWGLCGISYNHYTEGGAVSNVNVKRNPHDNIATIDLQGPVHITYINEKNKAPSEIPIGQVKLSRDALLYISLMTCINLPDTIDSEESL